MALRRLPSAEAAPTPRNNNGSLASLKERFPGHICNFAESHSPNRMAGNTPQLSGCHFTQVSQAGLRFSVLLSPSIVRLKSRFRGLWLMFYVLSTTVSSSFFQGCVTQTSAAVSPVHSSLLCPLSGDSFMFARGQDSASFSKAATISPSHVSTQDTAPSLMLPAFAIFQHPLNSMKLFLLHLKPCTSNRETTSKALGQTPA